MAVRLKSLASDLQREEKGDWVEYPQWEGVAFLVSSSLKPAYATARDLLLQKMARKYKGAAAPREEVVREFGKLACNHLLHGWRGLDEEYSPERAIEVLCDPAYREVANAVIWCAEQIGRVEVEFVEEAAKNSEAPSATA